MVHSWQIQPGVLTLRSNFTQLPICYILDKRFLEKSCIFNCVCVCMLYMLLESVLSELDFKFCFVFYFIIFYNFERLTYFIHMVLFLHAHCIIICNEHASTES